MKAQSNPEVKVNGPYRANNEQCSFVLDASGSLGLLLLLLPVGPVVESLAKVHSSHVTSHMSSKDIISFVHVDTNLMIFA